LWPLGVSRETCVASTHVALACVSCVSTVTRNLVRRFPCDLIDAPASCVDVMIDLESHHITRGCLARACTKIDVLMDFSSFFFWQGWTSVVVCIQGSLSACLYACLFYDLVLYFCFQGNISAKSMKIGKVAHSRNL